MSRIVALMLAGGDHCRNVQTLSTGDLLVTGAAALAVVILIAGGWRLLRRRA
jgi:hypothetical protein